MTIAFKIRGREKINYVTKITELKLKVFAFLRAEVEKITSRTAAGSVDVEPDVIISLLFSDNTF